MKIFTLKAENNRLNQSILFVHGVMHASWCWKKYYMPFFQSQGYDVHAIDLSNHGENIKQKSLKFTSIGDYVNDVKEAIDFIGEDCILVGHSMGGMIVQKYLEEHTCSKAVLITPVPPKGVYKTVLNLALKHPIRFLMSNIKMSLLPILKYRETSQYLFFGYTMEKEVLEESLSLIQDESYFAFLGIIFPFLKKSKQKTKMLVVAATEDNAISLADNESTAKFHDAELVVFENMAHDMMLEKEWIKPAQYIADWLIS